MADIRPETHSFYRMSLIPRLEQRFGRFAIPGLLHILAVIQLVTLVAFYVASGRDAGEPFISALVLDAGRVMSGEVWRLVSYLFLPRSLSILWGVIGAFFLMWIGSVLEQAWGAFRLNVYVFTGIFFLTVSAFVMDGSPTNIWLMESIFFAVAMLVPDEEIRLYGILPVKMKWLAWIGAAFMFFAFMADPSQRVPIIASNLNFLIFFGPSFLKGAKHRAEVMGRRKRFDDARDTGAAFFHQCKVCGKTEVDDPALDFRVTAQGDEICAKCKARV
jgi:uncharacterized membrane protein